MKPRSPFASIVPSLCVLLALLSTACTSPLQRDANDSATPTVKPLRQTLAWTKGQSWHVQNLPSKKSTQFTTVQEDGRDAVLAVANSSASLLRQHIHIPAHQLQRVKFSWKVPQLIDAADMATREADDSPVRIILTFEGDRSGWSAKNTMLSELSQVLTGEELPYATLMYVWCNKRTPGSVLINPRTDRIRKIVIESGSKNLNQWLEYERDIQADFRRAFGESPGALVGMALMTDTDNTQSQTRAYYGPISMRPTTSILGATPQTQP